VNAPAFPEPAYPTPLRLYSELSSKHCELWIKNDGLTHPVYGGNKVRKLRPLLAEARARRCSRVLTFGAAGSHHVLATTVFARAAGLSAAAVLAPQRWSEHAEMTLRAALAGGLEVHAGSPRKLLSRVLFDAIDRHTYVIPPGGSNVLGTLAYADAAAELAAQLELEGVPKPDAVVVALGSGATCAGLLAGFAVAGLATHVHGVLVAHNPGARLLVLGLARAALRRRGLPWRSGATQLRVESGYVGPGYAANTPAGERAVRAAARVGLDLDSTYTAKAFACAQALVANTRCRRVLYWHTLSAAPLSALLPRDTAQHTLPDDVRALFR